MGASISEAFIFAAWISDRIMTPTKGTAMTHIYSIVGQAVVFYYIGRFAAKFGAAFREEITKDLAQDASETESNS